MAWLSSFDNIPRQGTTFRGLSPALLDQHDSHGTTATEACMRARETALKRRGSTLRERIDQGWQKHTLAVFGMQAFSDDDQQMFRAAPVVCARKIRDQIAHARGDFTMEIERRVGREALAA